MTGLEHIVNLRNKVDDLIVHNLELLEKQLYLDYLNRECYHNKKHDLCDRIPEAKRNISKLEKKIKKRIES